MTSAPREALTPTPTPLQPAPRFGAAIGREVWIKRDDIWLDRLRSSSATTAGVGPGDLGVTYDFIGDGYAAPTRDGVEAIRLLARTEGIVCDPVYSGKALAAVASVPGAGPGGVLAHGRRPVGLHDRGCRRPGGELTTA